VAKTPQDAVGLMLMFRNPKPVGILRVRGPLNEHGKPQKWQNGCQTAVAGKKEPEDSSYLATLWREIGEEICPEFVEVVQEFYRADKLVQLVDREDPVDHMRITVWGVMLERATDFDMVTNRLSASGDSFRLIRADEVKDIVDLQKIPPETGVTDGKIAMFPLPKEAVVEAFAVFG